jgi:hypothetical protein
VICRGGLREGFWEGGAHAPAPPSAADAKARTERVAVCRRLKRIGAVQLTTSTYLLPDRPTQHEQFQWLAGQIRDSGGEATLVRAQEIEGMSRPKIVALFDAVRDADYGALMKTVRPLLRTKKADEDAAAAEATQSKDPTGDAGGQLDLKDNDLIVHGGTLANIRAIGNGTSCSNSLNFTRLMPCKIRSDVPSLLSTQARIRPTVLTGKKSALVRHCKRSGRTSATQSIRSSCKACSSMSRKRGSKMCSGRRALGKSSTPVRGITGTVAGSSTGSGISDARFFSI